MKKPIILFFLFYFWVYSLTSCSVLRAEEKKVEPQIDLNCEAFVNEKICNMTPWLCGICTSVHGSNFETKEEKDLKENLRPITKGHLIQKAKAGHSRRTKIVGGTPVKQGESPWTVRYVLV